MIGRELVTLAACIFAAACATDGHPPSSTDLPNSGEESVLPSPDLPLPFERGECEKSQGGTAQVEVVLDRAGCDAPFLLMWPVPSFPDGARSRCVAGFALLEFLVEESGAFAVRMLASEPEHAFGNASLRAAEDFHFAPAKPGRLTGAFLYFFSPEK